MNVLPVSMYKKIFHDFTCKKIRPIQVALEDYKSIDMTVIGFCIVYIHETKLPQVLIFNVTDIKDRL